MNKLKELRSICETMFKHYPLDLREEDGQYECPACNGEGYVDGTGFDTQLAASIQAYGIGSDLADAEKFVEKITPKTVLALIKALEEGMKALSYYGKDWHIRDYEHGQLVILQSEEVSEDQPNKAAKALAQIEKLLEELK